MAREGHEEINGPLEDMNITMDFMLTAMVQTEGF